MSEQISVPGGALAKLAGQFLLATNAPATNEWLDLLESVRLEVIPASLAEKTYWTDIYRRRQQVASDVNSGLAGDLARVVNDLSRFNGEHIALAILNGVGYGYFIWMSPDLSCVVSCFRARDKRCP